MEIVGAYEAKTHLAELLERVAKGQLIAITKHGIPVAILQPYEPEKGIDVANVSYLDLAMRQGLPLATLDRKLIEAARRLDVPVLVI